MWYVFYYDIPVIQSFMSTTLTIIVAGLSALSSGISFVPPTGEADDEAVRKIQIGEKVDRGDGDVGPAIEIELEPPPADRDSAASSASVDLDEEEEEVIRIESIEVTTLEPGEVEELKVRGGIGAAK